MKSVIKRDHVQLAEPAAAAPRKPDARSAGAACAAPRVRLVPGDGASEGVQLLELTCSCGEVSLIEVQCEKKS
jgi:hypothetical protein